MSTYKDKYIKYKKKYFSLKYSGSFFDKLGSMASRGGNTVSSPGDEKVQSVKNIWIASKKGDKKTVMSLINKGADIDQVNKDGATPLYLASESGSIETARFLIDSKADLNKAEKKGYTPLLVASQKGNTEIVRLLIKNKVDINKATKKRVTPLFIATYNQHMPVIRLLVEAGADLEIRNNYTGETALAYAKYKEYKKIEEYLNEAKYTRNIRESMEYHSQRHSRNYKYRKMINKLPSKINLIINAAKKLPGIENFSEIKVSSEDLPEVSIKKHISNYVKAIQEIKKFLNKNGRDILIDYLDELEDYNLEPTGSMWPVDSHINMMAERLWNNDIIDDEEFGKIVGEKEAKAKIESLSPYD